MHELGVPDILLQAIFRCEGASSYVKNVPEVETLEAQIVSTAGKLKRFGKLK